MSNEASIMNLVKQAQKAANDGWMEKLATNKDDTTKPTPANAFLILTNAQEWHRVIGFDEFARKIVKLAQPPFENGKTGSWNDQDDSNAMLWLSQNYRVDFKTTAVSEAVRLAADRNKYHPVHDYLNGLSWDGAPRLQHWLSAFLGAEESEYHSRIGKKVLVSAVARIFEPGCKVDTMMILEGGQGEGKSTALSILTGKDWFLDTPLAFGEKDCYQALRGKWISEISELADLNRADHNRAKQFISQRVDTYRPSYARSVEDFPREIIFIGTVNDGQYLKDSTGNRRYWPVKCGTIGQDNLGELRSERDQLWAEAVHLYHQKFPHWETKDDRELFRGEQEQRYIGDAWEQKIEEFLANRDSVTMPELLGEALGIETSRWNNAAESRVGKIILNRLGWKKRQPMKDGKRGYEYFRQ